MPITLQLLGTPQVHLNHPLLITQNNPSLLLLYLAHRGQWISRSELAFLFRPDDDEAEAKEYVRLLLHRAKQLSWSTPLEITRQQVRFKVDTDIQIFQEAIAKQNWEQAIKLYTGSFLGDMSVAELPTYTTWLELERSELQQDYQHALTQQAKILESKASYNQASEVLTKLLRLDNLDEEVFRWFLRMLYLSGNGDSALKAYGDFCELLKQELETEPDKQTQELIQTIQDNQPLGLKTTHTSINLPAQNTRFIGRKKELQKAASYLQEDCRLLTLIGMGGTGKTRLALEIARNLQHVFPDGIYFVALAALDHSDFVLSTIVSSLEIPPSNQSPKTQIETFLKDKQVLLVLDNLEHLLSAASHLADLITALPKLKMLATSRERLNLSAEWLFDIEGLDYPQTLEGDLAGYDAVALFINGSKRVAPDIDLSKDLTTIADITRRLEGLPLAIELASSWTRIMPVARIASELDKGLDFLESELSDLPERHRNLKAILDRTWQGLPEKKRLTLARLSVFSGGCSLEAAEQVCDVPFSLLLGLVNESLIRRTPPDRFDMHELIRHYAKTRLQQEGSFEATYQKHFSYYFDLAKEADTHLNSAKQVIWKKRLGDDYANWNNALEWGFQNCVANAIALTAHLSRYWEATGLFYESQHWLTRALGQAKESPLEIQVKLLLKQLSLSVSKGDYPQFETYAATTLSLCQQIGTPETEAEYYNLAGWLATDQRHYTKAEALLLQGLDFVRDHELSRIKNYLLLNLGRLAAMQHHFEKALRTYQDCLDLARERCDLRLEMIALNNSAALYLSKGDWEKSVEMSRAALPMAKEVNDKIFQTIIQGNLGYALWQQGKHGEGERIYREHVLLLFEQGNLPHFVENSFELALFWHQLNHKDAAVRLWYAAEQFRQFNHYPEFTGYQEIKDKVLGGLSQTEGEELLVIRKNQSSSEMIKLIRTQA